MENMGVLTLGSLQIVLSFAFAWLWTSSNRTEKLFNQASKIKKGVKPFQGFGFQSSNT